MRAAEPRPAGARPLHLPDWPFGAVGRRLLLEALLTDRQPDAGWHRKELERRAGVSNGGLDVLLAGTVDLGLASITDGRILRAEKLPDLAEPLSDFSNTRSAFQTGLSSRSSAAPTGGTRSVYGQRRGLVLSGLRCRRSGGSRDQRPVSRRLT